MQKTRGYGDKFYKWFKSCLGDKKEIVVASGTGSESGIVSCGVPQGSIYTWSLIFLCYVNDISMSKIYATLLCKWQDINNLKITASDNCGHTV